MGPCWCVLVVSLFLLKSSKVQTLSLSVTPSSPVVGQEVTFTCTTSQDITTTTTLYYRRDALQVVDITVNSTSCYTTTALEGQNYVITCGSLPLRKLSLTILAAYVTEDEHGTNWRCNIFLGGNSNTVQLTLSVPVSTVTMTTNGVYQPSVTISAGNTRTFTCTTAASQPVARISWIRRGNNITDQAGTATDQDVGDDKYTKQQRLTITGRVNDVDSGLRCEAVNIDGMAPVSSPISNIIVQWEPQTDPTLTRAPPTTTLTEGVFVTLMCQQIGGKPLATLTWSGLCSETTPTESSDTTTLTSRVQLSVNRTYNGQTCTCESRHPVKRYLRSISETFNVLYGPDTVTIFGNQQIVADGVRELTLTCVTSPYHQYVTLTWKRGNSLLTGASSPSNTTTTDGTVTSQDLALTPDRTWGGDIVYCTAGTIGTTIQTTASVHLDLLYGPGTTVVLSPTDTRYTKTEGDTLPDITCTADCRPDCTFVWTKPDNTNFTTSPVLSLGQLDKSKHGTYTCTARNNISQSTTATYVAVHYRPAQPVKLVISHLTSSSVALSWEPGNEQRSYDTFRLTYQKHEDISTTSVTLNKTTTAFTIGQLLPSTQYDVFVTAVYLGGTSEALSGAFVTPELHNTGVCPLSENAGNTGVTLIAVASVLILLSLLIFAVAIFMLRKGRLPYVRQTSKDKSRSANKAQRSADIGEFGLDRYEDLNLEQIEPPSEYQEVLNNTPDNDNNTAGNTSNVYEHLRQQSAANTYEDIPPKPGTGSDSMYINTAQT